MTHYIGIDISKKKLDLAWLKDTDNIKVKTKIFKNDKSDFTNIIDWLTRNITIDLTELHICLEATGVYHESIAYYLHDQGIAVSIINPAYVKSYGDSLGSRNKTDKKDSVLLARYAYSVKPDVWTPPPAQARHLKSLLARLSALEEDRQRELNRLEQAESTDTTPIVKQSIEQMIKVLDKVISDLNGDIDDHINKHPELKQDQVLLESIQGVGSAVSRQMLSLMHNKSFSSASQLAAFLGLVPRHHESGMFKGKSRLAKNGASDIRAKLFMPALVAIKHNPDIKAQYERLLANGKCKMQAVCAAMRKLVHICYGVVKHQTLYVPRVDLSP